MNKHVMRLNVLHGADIVGMLALADRGGVIFEYNPGWISNGFDLAPKSLTFDVKPQIAKDSLFDGLHGVFNDSLPDGWGLLLMDRFFKNNLGWGRNQITPLDRLAYIGTRAMGALSYQPEYESEVLENSVNLSELAASVEKVLSGSVDDVFTQLRIQGGSPGGARPKVTVALSEHSREPLKNSVPRSYSIV